MERSQWVLFEAIISSPEKRLLNIAELDLVPFLVTFIACLVLGIEVGILIGVVIDVVLLLYYSARPKLLIEQLIVSLFQLIKKPVFL